MDFSGSFTVSGKSHEVFGYYNESSSPGGFTDLVGQMQVPDGVHVRTGTKGDLEFNGRKILVMITKSNLMGLLDFAITAH